MRAKTCSRRVALMAACCVVFAAEAAHAQGPSIRFSGPEPSVFESDPGGPVMTLTFNVALSSASNQNVTALFSTSTIENGALSGTTCAGADNLNGPDFIGVSQLVTIPANSLSTTVDVTVCRDNQVEFHQTSANQTREDFLVSLTSPTNAHCIGAECLSFGHIFDDDGVPFASVNSVTVKEPLSGSKTATFTVTLSHPHPGFEVRVGWATRNGTAHAFAGTGPGACGFFSSGGYPDYFSAAGTLVFPSNDMSETLPVTVCADPVSESTETYFVDLTGKLNVSASSIPGTGSILNFQLPSLGDFTLDPEGADVQAGEWLPYRFAWTLTGGVWRDLKTLELRVRQRGTHDVPLWIRWVESTNTFQLCESRGHSDDDNDDDDDADRRWTDRAPHPVNARCGTPVVAGTDVVLHAPLARFNVAGARVIGSGPTGPSVTLELPVSFRRGAAHHTYDVEVAAESDAGFRDDFIAAGVLVVRR